MARYYFFFLLVVLVVHFLLTLSLSFYSIGFIHLVNCNVKKKLCLLSNDRYYFGYNLSYEGFKRSPLTNLLPFNYIHMNLSHCSYRFLVLHCRFFFLHCFSNKFDTFKTKIHHRIFFVSEKDQNRFFSN